MTAAEFRAYVDEVRQRVAANLAAIDALDAAGLSPATRADIAAERAGLLDLQASLTDEALAAEIEATEHAGRELTPEEVRAIRVRQ